MAEGTLATQKPSQTFAELVRINPTDGESLIDGLGNVPDAISVLGLRMAGHPIYDVTHPNYGAVGDGATDDTAAIQAALDDAAAAGGGVVFVPSGTYVHAGLTIPSNTVLSGAGRGISVLKLADGANAHAIQNSDTVNGNSGIEFRDLTLDFNGANQAADAHGIRGERVFDLRMNGCELKNAYHHNLVSDTPTAGENERWTIVDCTSTGAGVGADGDGFRLSDGFVDGSDGATLVGCTANGNSHHGFHLGAGVTAVGCHASANGDAASTNMANYLLAGAGAQLNGCYGLGPVAENVIINATRCKVTGGDYVGAGADMNVIKVLSPGTRAAIVGAGIDASTSSGTQGSGIHIEAVAVKVASCPIIATKRAGIFVASTVSDVTLIGNDCSGGVRDGIEFNGNVTRATVVGNTCQGNAGADIRLVAGLTNSLIEANHLHSATQVFGTPGANVIVRNDDFPILGDLSVGGDAAVTGAITAASGAITGSLTKGAVEVETETGSQAKVDDHADNTTAVHGVGVSTVESATGSQAKVDTHAALDTGVHGVGASTIESAAGAQMKVDTHAALTGDAGHIAQQAASPDLNQTISDPPTQAEVQALSDDHDALKAILRAAGILAV